MEGQTVELFNARSFADFGHSCFVNPDVICSEGDKQ